MLNHTEVRPPKKVIAYAEDNKGAGCETRADYIYLLCAAETSAEFLHKPGGAAVAPPDFPLTL